MIRNYLKIAYRNLIRHKTYAAMNVLGLGLGATCGILIFVLVSYHLSFDAFHPNADRIYRFVTELHRETVNYSGNVPSPLGKAFRNDYNFAEKVARIASFDGALITVNDKSGIHRSKEHIAYTEADFFAIFNYPLVQGDHRTLLTEPNTAILTEQMATRYFGSTSPINKVLRVNNKIDLRITGVLKDLPANTDRQTDLFISYSTLKQHNEWLASDDEGWGGIDGAMQCFVRLRPGVSSAQVEQVLPAYVKKYRPTNKNIHHYKLQPLSDVHFNPQYGGQMSKSILWVLGLIGLFLIGTACINFINLATTQALSRAKEIGVRKVLGSVRTQLFGQFLAETALVTIAAVVLALVGVQLTLPILNNWFDTRTSLQALPTGSLVAFVALLMVTVTLLAGAYPGIIVARFKPVQALKGRISQQHVGGFATRRLLIVGQFTLSQLLIIGMFVMANQMRYATQTDLGFVKDAVVMLPVGRGATVEAKNGLKDRLTNVAGVKQVSLCRAAPLSDNNWTTLFKYDNRVEDEGFAINMRSADEQYIPMFGLRLIAGRNLYPSDTVREFVVNEMFAKKLNLMSVQELLGKKLSVNGGSFRGQIVGVVRDFHDLSYLENINAVAITTLPNDYSSYAIKIDLTRAETTLAALNKTWSETHPDQLFEYKFLDDQIARLYESVSLMLKLIEVFAAIAIFISCLGLYGLVSFMATQKTKEIGIRKVLGSSVSQIVWIFGREFARLILIAFVIAAPVGYLAMNAWLKLFKYQIDIGIGVFALTITGTLLIALLTISFQSIKAALMNPVKSLRSE